MLRRSSLRMHYLLSGYSHGRSAKSMFPGTSLDHCGCAKLSRFLNPVITMSPIQHFVSQYLRQYCSEPEKELVCNKPEKELSKPEKELACSKPEKELARSKPKKEYKEVNLACPEDIERLKQYLVEAEQERAERILAKGGDPNVTDSEDEQEIRYEDYEPELKIFEDPFLDRQPPPEPDEQTKKDVAEMIETLKLLVEQMPMQKPSKKRQDRGNKEKEKNSAQEKEDAKHIQAALRLAKMMEESFGTEDDQQESNEKGAS